MPHILIVSSPYYTDIAQHLEQGAMAALKEAGATMECMHVPGALEIPPAISIAHQSRHFDGYVALGCIIRGETYHFEIVSNESAHGLMTLSTQHALAIGNGILTVENQAQALTRAHPAEGNKGGGAAKATLALVNVQQQIAHA